MGQGRGRYKCGIAVLSVFAVMLAAFAIVSPARATFPGSNGLIAFTRRGNVYVVNPNSSVPLQITNTGNFGTDVEFNATGNTLVGSTPTGLVTFAPVSGASLTVIPNTNGSDSFPTFDPTGTKLAFNTGGSVEGPGLEIATINVNGSDKTVINTFGGAPDWSPDGTFIAYHEGIGTAIKRITPTGGVMVTIATTGPDGTPCDELTPCRYVTISPDSQHVLFGAAGGASECDGPCEEECEGPCEGEGGGTGTGTGTGETTFFRRAKAAAVGGGGLGEIKTDGTSIAPRRITFEGESGPDGFPSYSPDGTKVAFVRGSEGLATVPTDGSGIVTVLILGGDIETSGRVEDTSWAPIVGTGTGTGTAGSVISVAAARAGKDCNFTITATPAGAGITVDHQITNRKGKVKASGDDVAVPATVTEKSKRKRIITLSDPKGATLGTATAACPKK